MSRYYEASVEIEEPDKLRKDQIVESCCEEWAFDKESFRDFERGNGAKGIEAVAQDRLCGGETEDEFAARMATAIWTANGGYCRVVVNTLYLEELPYEAYPMEETEYEEIMNGAES